MLLTITTTYRPANDLGYLLHKHPERFQSFDLSFGKAHVYYPEVGAERCTVSKGRGVVLHTVTTQGNTTPRLLRAPHACPEQPITQAGNTPKT